MSGEAKAGEGFGELSFSEILVLKPAEDSYQRIQFGEDRIEPDDTGGQISTRMRELEEQFVHPDYRADYRRFWDVETLAKRALDTLGQRVLSLRFLACNPENGINVLIENRITLADANPDNPTLVCISSSALGTGAVEVSDGRGRADVRLLGESAFFAQVQPWCDQMEGSRVAVLALDVNYFNMYNAIYGRDAGDELLERIGAKIGFVANTVGGIGGYFGGDNFVLAIPAERMADAELKGMIEADFGDFGTAQGFKLSIGVCAVPGGRINVTELYDHALIALATAKASYAERIVFYDEESHRRMLEDRVLLTEAQRGLDAGEFEFWLQPKVDIVSGKVVAAEALVRWVRDGQLVSPAEFIPQMEESGHIFALDEYIWEEVFKWQRSRIDAGVKPLPVSVNVSRVDFLFTNVAECFIMLAERYSVPPQAVEVEITESAYAQTTGIVEKEVDALRQRGFTVAIDDFGSGYSSLNMLRGIHVDLIKIDKRFLDLYQAGSHNDDIVESVINMAHTLGLPVVAEGMETEQQRAGLVELGCDYVQGFYFFRPMPVVQFEELVAGEDRVARDTGYPQLVHGPRRHGRVVDEAGYNEFARDVPLPFAILKVHLDENGTCDNATFVHLNAAFERESNTSADQLIGRPFLDMVREADASWFDRGYRAAREGKTVSVCQYSMELGCWVQNTMGPGARPDHMAFSFQRIPDEALTTVGMSQLTRLVNDDVAACFGQGSYYGLMRSVGVVRADLSCGIVMQIDTGACPVWTWEGAVGLSYESAESLFLQRDIPAEHVGAMREFVNRGRLLGLFAQGVECDRIRASFVIDGAPRACLVSAHLSEEHPDGADAFVQVLFTAVDVEDGGAAR